MKFKYKSDIVDINIGDEHVLGNLTKIVTSAEQAKRFGNDDVLLTIKKIYRNGQGEVVLVENGKEWLSFIVWEHELYLKNL